MRLSSKGQPHFFVRISGSHSDIIAGMVFGSSDNISSVFNNEYMGPDETDSLISDLELDFGKIS